MKITYTNEKSTLKAKVVFEKREWQDAQQKALVAEGKKIEIKGFRKGEAPVEILKKHVDNGAVLDSAANMLLDQAYSKVLEEKKPEIAGKPAADYGKVTLEELECTFVIPLFPEFEMPKYKDIEFKKEKVEVTEEEINNELTRYQNQNSEVMVKEDGVIEKGNIVNFDFEGFVDGVAFEGGKAEKFDLEIGSGQFIPGFEDQMVGLKKGDKKDIEVTFPENYTANLAGKKAVFKLKINEVSTKIVPELNDDLALDCNIENVSTLEELKKHIKEDIASAKEDEVKSKAIDGIVKQIVDSVKMDVPELLIVNEAEHQLHHFKEDVEQRGLTFDKYLEMTKKTEEDVKKELVKSAEENLKTMFVLSKIAEKEKITVEQKDIDAEVEKMAKMYNMEVAKIKELLGDRINELANQIYSQKLMDFIVKANKII